MARGVDASQHRPMTYADEGLVAERVSALRGERLVLDAVSLAVPRGAAMLLTGPNGAGKSTLLRLLAGLLRADAGVVRWRGAALEGGQVAYLGHLDALKPALTPMETLGLWCDPARARTALDASGLAALAELPVRVLSAGQRRRLALARLAVRNAPVWLLDEPTVGLDTVAVERLGTAMAAHRAGGGVIVAATHLPLPLVAATLALG